MDETAPWWVGGEETCPFCAGGYAYEVEVRCVECDRPACPLCVVVIRDRRELICPECQPAGG